MADLLTLPSPHTEEDLELARLLAEVLGCGELHVFWTAEEPAAPS